MLAREGRSVTRETKQTEEGAKGEPGMEKKK